MYTHAAKAHKSRMLTNHQSATNKTTTIATDNGVDMCARCVPVVAAWIHGDVNAACTRASTVANTLARRRNGLWRAAYRKASIAI